MMTPLRSGSPYPLPPRGTSFPRPPDVPTDQPANRTLSLVRKSGVRRLPDFSIFIPRDPSAALPEGVPASILRRSGFVL